MERLRKEHGLTYRQLCRAADLPYSTFMRWKRRTDLRQPLLLPPGPKKLEAPDWDEVFEDLLSLKHGRKRTRGTGALWREKYRHVLSRREFGRTVAMVRRGLLEERRADLTRVQWHVPGLVWALDPTELDLDGECRHIQGTTVQDLASRYVFDPIAGRVPCGEEVAGHLSRLFGIHHPPLFLKRDNAGNLNHPSVNEVLAESWVIPLNSPVRYPQYNGAVEHMQEELQTTCGRQLADRPQCPVDHIEAYVQLSSHDLNHRPRRSLGHMNACQVFHADPHRAMVDRNARKEVTDQLIVVTAKALESIEKPNRRAVQRAWRLAVEAWLVENNVITLSRNQASVTRFSEKSVSRTPR
jgi:hypothetical protein